MPRLASFDWPTGDDASWLGILPPSPSTPPFSEPVVLPSPDQAIITRLAELHEGIADVNTTIDNRTLLRDIAHYDSLFCTSCGPTKPGMCDPTCPLLGPSNRGSRPHLTKRWLNQVRDDYDVCWSVRKQMADIDDCNIDSEKLSS